MAHLSRLVTSWQVVGLTFLAGLLDTGFSEKFVFCEQQHGCGVCREVLDGVPCDLFGACHIINSSAVEHGCTSFCGPTLPSRSLPVVSGVPDVRVVKGFGTKGYDQIRISVISEEDEEISNPDFFDYSSRFKYKWTDTFLHSSMKTAVPGQVNHFPVGPGLQVVLPKQGAGTAGVLIGDPCVNGGSIMGYVFCSYGTVFQTYNRTVELLNTFVEDASTDYWGILGDNFYDRMGAISKDVFRRLSWQTKSKIFLTVPGNHDYWVMGHPYVSTYADQCGNGFMQFYAQDAIAAAGVLNGSDLSPFDFSVDPEEGRTWGCNLASLSNMFWYNQIGNVGLVGQSAGHSLNRALPFMLQACKWLASQDGLEVAVLVGHWDVPDNGAYDSMDMPEWFHAMAHLPGCDAFYRRGTLKYVMGHTHCNEPHPRGDVGSGFRVGAFGMTGCGNYGMPILDTTENQIRFWYFDTSSDEKYNDVIACVRKRGWRRCPEYATMWHTQPLPSARVAEVVV